MVKFYAKSITNCIGVYHHLQRVGKAYLVPAPAHTVQGENIDMIFRWLLPVPLVCYAV
jgi:hypothetical protein